MTEEQILLARPDLNADMIKALVDGSKDKELADKQVQMGQENVKMMKDFMVKQLDATRDITKDSESNKQKEIDRIQKTVGQTEESFPKWSNQLSEYSKEVPPDRWSGTAQREMKPS